MTEKPRTSGQGALEDRIRRASRVLFSGPDTADPALPEAVVQACLDEALATAADPPADFLPALRCLLGHLRSNHRPTPPGSDDGEGSIAATWDAAVAARLRRLPPGDRALLLLTFLEGFAPAEAAVALDADPSGVERHLRRAVAVLFGDARGLPSQGRPRLLVVEDEAVAARELREALEELGLEVVGVAATAGQAVSQASLRRPDLALVDIRLRGATDGVAATREIQDRVGVPAVVVTAYPDQRARAEAERPYGFLAKPWSEAGLHAAVSAALSRAALERHFPLAGPHG